TRSQGRDEADGRLALTSRQCDDQVITVWLYGVVGDTAKCAEIDTLTLDRFYCVGVNATWHYCHGYCARDETYDALFHGAPSICERCIDAEIFSLRTLMTLTRSLMLSSCPSDAYARALTVLAFDAAMTVRLTNLNTE